MYFWTLFVPIYFLAIPLVMFYNYIHSDYAIKSSMWKWWLSIGDRLTWIGKSIYYPSTLGFVLWDIAGNIVVYLYYVTKKLVIKKKEKEDE